MVFQPNSKYLHIGISFQWQPTCVDFKNMAERFPECVNAVYFNSVAMSTFRSEIVTIPFRLWLYYLLFSPRKWTMSRQDSTIHEWNWRLCERTRAYVRVNCQILTGANRNIWMVSCVFTSVVFCWKHGGKVSWMSVNAVYLNSMAMSRRSGSWY